MPSIVNKCFELKPGNGFEIGERLFELRERLFKTWAPRVSDPVFLP